MTAPTGEVERVAAALEDLIHDAPEPEIERVLTESLALLLSLAKDAARLQLALATERGKLEKADAVADAWARDAARYAYVRCLGPRAFHSLWEANLRGDVAFDELVDRAIEAAGRTEGGGG
jgi:hypothetical protein